MCGFEEIVKLIIEKCIGPLVRLCVEDPTNWIRESVSASNGLNHNYTQLNRRLKTLLGREHYRENQIPTDRQNDTTEDYQTWKSLVSDVKKEVIQLKAGYEQAKNLSPFCFVRRSRVSKMITECREQVDKLIEEERSEELKTLLDYRRPKAVKRPSNASSIDEYPTLEGALNEILEGLKNDKIKAIGVHGTTGVGKTTILKNLIDRKEISVLFDDVIFIEVKADQNNEPQQAIADRLEVNIEDISNHTDEITNRTDEIATKINGALNNKKYLLILDGVKNVNYLEKLGIPANINGSYKVVVASQSLYVCNWYEKNQLVLVNPLQPSEAYKMFENIVGREVLRDPGKSRVAHNVCSKCSGLPLLIHKTAMIFKSKPDVQSWNSMRRRLDQQRQNNDDEGVEGLYTDLSFCFEELTREQKKCFLYTSLYPADSKVYTDYLVECCAAQGFFGDFNEKRFQEIRDDGRTAIGELINLSLLGKGERMMYVIMNVHMRQLARHILPKYPQFKTYIMVADEDFNKLSESKTLPEAKWASMINTRLKELPTSENCKMLETLLLQKNSKLATIPDSFFDRMGELLLLDLHKTGITKLPSTVSELTSLKVLYLNACMHLSMLPSEMAALTSLQVLDIRGSQVAFIPSSIGSLINLRCLRIPYIIKSGLRSDCEDAKNVICKLEKLEELIIEVTAYEEWSKQAKDVIKQVSSLKKLTNVSCSFPSLEILKNFIAEWEQWEYNKQITSFQIVIGCGNSEPPQILQYFDYELSKYLKYNDDGRKKDIETTGGVLHEIEETGEVLCQFEVITEVLCEIEAFELACHQNIKSLSDLGMESLNDIRGILIDQCNNFSTTVEGDRNGLESILSNLELLYLRDLPKLKCVFKGPLHRKTFSELQILVLEKCGSLESIFSNGVIQNFSKLRKLEIRQCSTIQELIVITEDIEREEDVFPTLKEIELADLTELKFICRNPMLAWSTLELLKVHKCPNLKSLPFHKDKATKLGCIKGDQGWWNELGKESKEVHQQFEKIYEATKK